MALPVILEMIFLDVDKYIAVFWSGDFDYLDKRIEILYSQNKGKSEIITGLFKISKPFVNKTERSTRSGIKLLDCQSYFSRSS